MKSPKPEYKLSDFSEGYRVLESPTWPSCPYIPNPNLKGFPCPPMSGEKTWKALVYEASAEVGKEIRKMPLAYSLAEALEDWTYYHDLAGESWTQSREAAKTAKSAKSKAARMVKAESAYQQLQHWRHALANLARIIQGNIERGNFVFLEQIACCAELGQRHRQRQEALDRKAMEKAENDLEYIPFQEEFRVVDARELSAKILEAYRHISSRKSLRGKEWNTDTEGKAAPARPRVDPNMPLVRFSTGLPFEELEETMKQSGSTPDGYLDSSYPLIKEVVDFMRKEMGCEIAENTVSSYGKKLGLRFNLSKGGRPPKKNSSQKVRRSLR